MIRIFLFLLCFVPTDLLSDTTITVPVPEEAIRVYLGSIIPYPLIQNNENLSGRLKIEKIENFSVKKMGVSFLTSIKGKNLFYLKKEKNFRVKINIKKLEIKFRTDAKLLFNKKRRVLTVIPRITKRLVKSDSKRVEGHIQQVLSLLNNKKYPFKAEEIQPVLFKILKRKVKMDISNIRTGEGFILVDFIFNPGDFFK